MEMELRTQARVVALLTLLAAAAPAQTLDYPARWKRLWRSPAGTLSFSSTAVTFASADGKHSLSFPLADVQQFYLAPDRVAVLTYEDRTLHLGRDSRYEFDRLEGGHADAVYELLHPQLGPRLAAAYRGPDFPAEFEVAAKLLRTFGGPEGRLVVGGETIAFRSPEDSASRFWRIDEIESISRSGPMDLTVMAAERTTTSRLSPREFRFQLKQPLSEERFNRLWRRFNRAKGLRTFPQQIKE
jgi:hypothetical protein